MNLGHAIRDYRTQKGYSQGDLEKRSGLLRCYLSRVENGHTIPSLNTLAKIAGAMDISLSDLLTEDIDGVPHPMIRLREEELRFLIQMRRYSVDLDEADRTLLVDMVRKFASVSPAC
jgi:transcriptional regulator with XRE-family HTH domain